MMRKSIFSILCLVLMATLYGCANEPVIYEPNTNIPPDVINQRGELRIEILPQTLNKALGDRGYVGQSFMAEGDRQFIGNTFQVDGNWVPLWGAQNFPSGSPFVITTETGQWFLGQVFDDGLPQIGNVAMNGTLLHEYVAMGENIGTFARFKTMPSDSSMWVYQSEVSNVEDFTTVHYKLSDPNHSISEVRVYGTQTCWNPFPPRMIWNDEFKIHQIWLPVLKGTSAKIAFRAPGGAAIDDRPLYAKTDEMSEAVLVDCAEMVTNASEIFAEADWFSGSWLNNNYVFRLVVDEQGMIQVGCGGIPVTFELTAINEYFNQSDRLMAVMSGYNGGQSFELPYSGDRWRKEITMGSGEFDLSVWNIDDNNRPVVYSVRINNVKVWHLVPYYPDGGGEPGVKFVGIVMSDGSLIQGPDNRSGEIGS
ncbi:MAG: hypothetical protein V1853_03515 [bacterium]